MNVVECSKCGGTEFETIGYAGREDDGPTEMDLSCVDCGEVVTIRVSGGF